MKMSCVVDVLLDEDETVDVIDPRDNSDRRICRISAYIGSGVEQPEVALFALRVYKDGRTTAGDSAIHGVMQQAVAHEKSARLRQAVAAIGLAHRALLDAEKAATEPASSAKSAVKAAPTSTPES